MIAVREEERIRLRRKLHDELGPTLAGIALGIDTARRSLGHGTAASTDELLAPLRAEAERAVADIRRIAYNLRPPVLDQLGLGPALSEEALRMGRANVSIPAQLPPLPALRGGRRLPDRNGSNDQRRPACARRVGGGPRLRHWLRPRARRSPTPVPDCRRDSGPASASPRCVSAPPSWAAG